MGGFVGLGMARTHGETAIAEFRQHLANRAFVQHDAEAPFQLVTQFVKRLRVLVKKQNP